MGRWDDTGMGRTVASRGKPLGECGQKFVKVVIASQGAGRVCVAPHLVATDDDATRRDWHRNRLMDVWLDGWMDGFSLPVIATHFHRGKLINQLFSEFPSAHYIRINLQRGD